MKNAKPKIGGLPRMRVGGAIVQRLRLLALEMGRCLDRNNHQNLPTSKKLNNPEIVEMNPVLIIQKELLYPVLLKFICSLPKHHADEGSSYSFNR